ncbi:hypothetical protein DSL72_003548 [Monilinia vaccinii-corymbosi]|uniref:Uncharacterized protein n=1 Tax=Monilinia vaccinii-corymbosi TaxID=61207 RepID=A0A8A3P631_9HELO|nr:hypothetical protein DSL72_003548 [Monilinia vaccinii-corymbosi]
MIEREQATTVTTEMQLCEESFTKYQIAGNINFARTTTTSYQEYRDAMQHLKYAFTLFTISLLLNVAGARHHSRRQALCSPSSVPTSSPTTTSVSSSPPASTSPSSPPSPGPPNPPACSIQSPGICQLATKCKPSGNPLVQDAWIFNASCDVIGGTTGLALYQTWFLASQLPYGVVMTGNSPTASPSFLYAGGHYGVGGTDGGNPGWWCAIEADDLRGTWKLLETSTTPYVREEHIETSKAAYK